MSVTLINGIRAPAKAQDAARDFWSRAAAALAAAPGFQGAQLHTCLSPAAPFSLVNVAEWESPEHLEAALAQPEFQALLAELPEGWESLSGLYQPAPKVLPPAPPALIDLPDRWHFGGKGSGLEDDLARLVVEGKKTATSSWLAAYEYDQDPLPRLGERSVILDAEDRPVVAVQLVEVALRAFLEVDAAFARDEGEGDRSLAYWRRVHDRFFRSFAAEAGLTWDPDQATLVCERYRVLEVFEAGARWLVESPG